MRDPLKTAMESWAPSLNIVMNIIIVIIITIIINIIIIVIFITKCWENSQFACLYCGGDQNKVNWSGYDFDDFALFNIFNDVLWKDMDLETKHFHLKGRTCQ